MSMNDSGNIGSAYSYITRAFGNAIEFKRQPTGNPQERAMKVETFGNDLLERIKNEDASLGNSNVFPHSSHETTSTLHSLDKIFNIDRTSLPEPLDLVTKVEAETKKPKKSKFVVIEQAQASEPFKFSPESKKSGFKPPSSYDEEYDQGKLPKKRNKVNTDDKFKKTNMFQREQDLRNLIEKKSKK
ncbi:hypothetical protein DSO57_1018730 [Entomophthora muscae]|uniref:Uncharacterized protein n=2 Tax=Entomophthora muscae TaxID=34485 RepID=A0ACC2RIS9_9FUNG|nr:hypothetical protein DSO57_1018730 [Entomophthora muscae]